jgi:spore maturation protein CgeB
MKILIPAHAHLDNFEENVSHSLKAMGHDVLTAPRSLSQGPFLRWTNAYGEVLGKFGIDLPSAAERWALAAARYFRPDLVLALTQQLSEETLVRLKSSGVKHCVAWWGDAPANLKRRGLLTRGWDLLFLKDRDAVEKFRRVGVEAFHLHEAMNPAWHKPLASVANESIVVAGNWYAYRQALVARLTNNGVPIEAYGPPPPRWALPEIKKLHCGQFIEREVKSRIFGQALGCLNSSPFGEGNSLNCRAFEIAGAAGLQFIEHRTAIQDCFEPGREVLVFKTFEELLGQIEWARKAPREAARVRAAGARRAAAEHTYQHRLRAILELVRGA